jgi:hypothetical protein
MLYECPARGGASVRYVLTIHDSRLYYLRFFSPAESPRFESWDTVQAHVPVYARSVT